MINELLGEILVQVAIILKDLLPEIQYKHL